LWKGNFPFTPNWYQLNRQSSKPFEIFTKGMNMRIVIVCLAGFFLSTTCTGCSWLGQTAGKAQAKIERKVNAVEQGYEEGYKNEKSNQ
jgi:hypothetical protein